MKRVIVAEEETKKSPVNRGNGGGNSGCMYMCGLCKKNTTIFEKDIIMCKECGHRILYKQRSQKAIEYLAR